MRRHLEAEKMAIFVNPELGQLKEGIKARTAFSSVSPWGTSIYLA